ncbi:MAG: hypothetical protein LC685_00570, partial [Actinobacteria bacterium]|nr:hypothetical protein [Actinomycetota bacterium]
TATNSAGSASATSMPTAAVQPAPQPPQNTGAPTITGTASQGNTLTASNGTWSGYPAPTYGYQWQDCDQNGQNCKAISGATSQTYTLTSADVGATVQVVVTATNSAGSASASSAATPVVQPTPVAPQNTAAPSVSGSATEGQVLSAGNGTWTGTPAPSYSFQWQRCNSSGTGCAAISGATATSYTVLSADVASTLAVAVTAANSAGSATATSSATPVVRSAAGPLTSLLDDFNRPNNSGPPGPNWSHMPVSSSSSTNDLYITGGQVTGYAGSNGDYWNPQSYGPNSEVWVTVARKPTVDNDPVVLGLRFQNPGLSTASGYQAYYVYHSGQPDSWRISVRVNGVTKAILANGTGPTLNAGDEILFRAIGTTLELWRLSGGTWTKILNTTDSTITGAGYLNLSARDSAVRLANFGGGTLP